MTDKTRIPKIQAKCNSYWIDFPTVVLNKHRSGISGILIMRRRELLIFSYVMWIFIWQLIAYRYKIKGLQGSTVPRLRSVGGRGQKTDVRCQKTRNSNIEIRNNTKWQKFKIQNHGPAQNFYLIQFVSCFNCFEFWTFNLDIVSDCGFRISVWYVVPWKLLPLWKNRQPGIRKRHCVRIDLHEK